MRRIAALFLLCLFCVSFIGCATTHMTKMDSETRQPTTNVDIYTDKTSVKVPYKEIAILNAEGGAMASPETVMKSLIVKAKKIGANAIIYGGQGSKTNVSTIGGGLSANSVSTASAIAIVYLNDTPK